MKRVNCKKELISTIFVALFIATEAINLIVTRLLPLEGKFMSMFYSMTCIGIVVCYFFTGSIHRLNMRMEYFVGVVTVVLYYIITLFVVGGSSLSITYFLVFVLVPLLIPMLTDINIKVLLRIIFIIPSFGILKAEKIFLLTEHNAMTMGDCYALIIPIVAAATYLMVYYNEDNRRTKLLLLPSIIVNFVYFMRIVLYGSRGPILSGVLCFMFLTLFRKNNKTMNRKRVWKLIFFFMLIFSTGIFFWEILQFLSVLMSKAGINIRAIDKFFKLRQTSSAWNGRDKIIKITLSGVKEKPILGHGLSTFFNNTGIVYPHNFILQVLYDGGIILFWILIIPLIVGTVRVICCGNQNEFALFFALFFSSVPGALFSGDCWNNGCLWLLIGFIMKGQLPYRKGRRLILCE